MPFEPGLGCCNPLRKQLGACRVCRLLRPVGASVRRCVTWLFVHHLQGSVASRVVRGALRGNTCQPACVAPAASSIVMLVGSPVAAASNSSLVASVAMSFVPQRPSATRGRRPAGYSSQPPSAAGSAGPGVMDQRSARPHGSRSPSIVLARLSQSGDAALRVPSAMTASRPNCGASSRLLLGLKAHPCWWLTRRAPRTPCSFARRSPVPYRAPLGLLPPHPDAQGQRDTRVRPPARTRGQPRACVPRRAPPVAAAPCPAPHAPARGRAARRPRSTPTRAQLRLRGSLPRPPVAGGPSRARHRHRSAPASGQPRRSRSLPALPQAPHRSLGAPPTSSFDRNSSAHDEPPSRRTPPQPRDHAQQLSTAHRTDDQPDRLARPTPDAATRRSRASSCPLHLRH